MCTPRVQDSSALGPEVFYTLWSLTTLPWVGS